MEKRGNYPGFCIDVCAQPFGDNAGDVVEKAAPGNMDQTVDRFPSKTFPNGPNIG
jgi:hypothetical protein